MINVWFGVTMAILFFCLGIFLKTGINTGYSKNVRSVHYFLSAITFNSMALLVYVFARYIL